jgi:hypothetical protein
MGDLAFDAAIGGVTAGVLGGAGHGMLNDAIDAPQSQRQLNKTVQRVLTEGNVPNTEKAALDFRDALRKEQGDLNKAGKSGMREATKSDVVFSGRPDYEAIRTKPDAQTIPITSEGTPSAFALKAQIDGLGDSMTLKQVDELRTQARGLRADAKTTTDKAAVVILSNL